MSTKKKHIAVVCNYDLKPERIGGMDRFYVAFDSAVKEQGHRIDWYFSKYEPFPFFKNLNIKSAHYESVEALFLKETSVRYDTVITHFVTLCTPFYKQVKKIHNARIVAVDHNPRPIEGFPLKKRIKNIVKGILYSKYIDLFVGVSAYTRNHILKDYGSRLGKKAIVIYNGIDTTAYEIRTTPNTGKFLVASHLRRSKGIHDLIEAVNNIDRTHLTNVQVDIYGEGPEEQALKEQVHLSGLSHVIHFKGSTPDLPKLLKQYSYLLQPTYMECFSLSILESLVANVPVITTQVGGNLEVVTHGQNGWIHQAGDVPALTHILEQIIIDNAAIEQKDVATPVRNTYHLNKMVSDHISVI